MNNIIDISNWKENSNDLEIEKEWYDAFANYGYVIIIGHEIPSILFDQLKNDQKLFFDNEVEEKMKFNLGPYGKGGYSINGAESVGSSSSSIASSTTTIRKIDNIESYVIHPRQYIGTEILSYCPITSGLEYYNGMENLLNKVHQISTKSLGLKETNYFNQFYIDSNNDQHLSNGNALKLSHYPPQIIDNTNKDSTVSSIQYGEHTDFQGFTILNPGSNDHLTNESGGLEMKLKSNEWIPVKIPEDIKDKNPLIINAGDFIQIWTNDRWLSPYHRVKSPSPRSEAFIKSRYSSIFFSGPRFECIIESINELLTNDEVSNYAPVTAGQHLSDKLSKSSDTKF
jgi:isopenicillin N synthase-like dioxygenase